MERLIRILINRLSARGVDIVCIPPFIRNLVNTLASNPRMGLPDLNNHLKLLGWDNVEVDDHTIALIAAVWGLSFKDKSSSKLTRESIQRSINRSLSNSGGEVEPGILQRQALAG